MNYKQILISYLKKQYDLELIGKKTIGIGHLEVTSKNAVKCFTELFDGKLLKEVGALDLLTEPEKMPKLYQELYRELIIEVKPKLTTVTLTPNDNFVPATVDELLTYLPVRDYDTGKETRMLDIVTNRVSDLHYDTWKAKVGLKAATEVEKTTPLAKYVYDPRNIYKYEVVADKMNFKYTIVNLYLKPRWKSIEPKDNSLPRNVDIFFKHLFPNEKDREYIFYWIYHAITTRAYPYLYFLGAQGIGKGVLGETILPALIGRPNALAASKGDFFSAGFNAHLDKKSYIFVDEIRCRSEQERNTLKRLTNEKIQIEKKFQDAKEINNHASYILANNNEFAILVRPDDRRFSIPELTDKRLETALSSADIDGLIRSFSEDDAFVSQVGHWILNNFNDNKYSNRDVLQSKAFEEVVVSSASASYSSIIDFIFRNTHQEIFDLTDLKKKYYKGMRQEHWPSGTTINHFFKYFRWCGEIIIEYVKEDGDEILKFTDAGRKLFPKDNLLEELM